MTNPLVLFYRLRDTRMEILAQPNTPEGRQRIEELRKEALELTYQIQDLLKAAQQQRETVE